MDKQPFPAGIAFGDAFCNRVQEREKLKKSINSNQHIALISPRRYGKTSLMTQVLQENKHPSCMMDFFAAGNEKFVQDIIIKEVGRLLMTLLPKQKQMKEKLFSLFANFNPKIVLSALGQTIELFPAHQQVDETIKDLLLKLDNVAMVVKKRVVLVFDEFQQVGGLKESHVIEASIRHAAERSQNVNYFFSGSDRHMLEQMFSSKSRPLYRLCHLMTLGRIHRTDYENFIQAAAKKQWKAMLSDEVLTSIFEVSQYHPYYVNVICRLIWNEDSMCTDTDAVYDLWHTYVRDHIPLLAQDIGALSPNQRSLLYALAVTPTAEPQGQRFLSTASLAAGSVKQALQVLEQKDFIYQRDDKVYAILDPAIYTYLQQLAL